MVFVGFDNRLVKGELAQLNMDVVARAAVNQFGQGQRLRLGPSGARHALQLPGDKQQGDAQREAGEHPELGHEAEQTAHWASSKRTIPGPRSAGICLNHSARLQPMPGSKPFMQVVPSAMSCLEDSARSTWNCNQTLDPDLQESLECLVPLLEALGLFIGMRQSGYRRVEHQPRDHGILNDERVVPKRQ